MYNYYNPVAFKTPGLHAWQLSCYRLDDSVLILKRFFVWNKFVGHAVVAAFPIILQMLHLTERLIINCETTRWL